MEEDKRHLVKIIGSNIQMLRIQRGITQEKLAEDAGISTSFFANLERGHKGVSVFVLYKIAHCLGVSVDYLLYEDHSSAKMQNIEALLRDQPLEFIISVERIIRICVDEFSK